MNDDKKIKISSLGWLEAPQERKINLKDDSINDIGNSNLISSGTNFLKINDKSIVILVCQDCKYKFKE